MSVIDHFMNHPFRCMILAAIPDKPAITVARTLFVERVFPVFSPLETLHSDQSSEFENEFVKELQSVFGYSTVQEDQNFYPIAVDAK